MAQGKYSAGIFFVFLATIGWSLSGLFVRVLPELDGWQINAWRGLFMAFSMAVYLGLSHGRAAIDRFDDVPSAAFLISALCFALGTTVYMLAMQQASTATVSVIGATSPLITALFSPWITGERPGLLAWFSALLALIGMAVITQHGMALGNLTGIALSFGVPLTFAAQTLLLRRYRGINMMSAFCAGGLSAFVFAGVGSALLGHGSVLDIGPRALGILAAMGLLQLALPLIFYGKGAQAVPAVTLSLVAMLDAVLNPLWTLLVLGEKPEWTSVLGGAVILLAVLVNIVGSQVLRARRSVATAPI